MTEKVCLCQWQALDWIIKLETGHVLDIGCWGWSRFNNIFYHPALQCFLCTNVLNLLDNTEWTLLLTWLSSNIHIYIPLFPSPVPPEGQNINNKKQWHTMIIAFQPLPSNTHHGCDQSSMTIILANVDSKGKLMLILSFYLLQLIFLNKQCKK